MSSRLILINTILINMVDFNVDDYDINLDEFQRKTPELDLPVSESMLTLVLLQMAQSEEIAEMFDKMQVKVAVPRMDI